MSKFITKDDVWGIRKMLKKIYFSIETFISGELSTELNKELCFNIFFNQFLPPTYCETQETVIRHADQIREIIRKDYKKEWVWLRRPSYKNPKDLSCVRMNDAIMNEIKSEIKSKNCNLPLYLEIEETKKKWQAKEEYHKDQGFSNPIKEEYIQLRVLRKGV